MAYKPNKTEITDDEPTKNPFNSDSVLAEKERQEKELRDNAALIPESATDNQGVSVISGAFKLQARPKTGEQSFPEKLSDEDIKAGKKPKMIKYKLNNAVIITGTGRVGTKPGTVRMEVLPLDFLRLIQNAKGTKNFVAMLNLMANEERDKAISTENWSTIPE